MNTDIKAFNDKLEPEDKKICDTLATVIDKVLPEAENKIWHAHPVWFLDGNPVVVYSKLKDAVTLLFWSGNTFEEPNLVSFGKFKSADIRYTNAKEINTADRMRWLKQAGDIQWDYKNIVKRRGQLERLKESGSSGTWRQNSLHYSSDSYCASPSTFEFVRVNY